MTTTTEKTKLPELTEEMMDDLRCALPGDDIDGMVLVEKGEWADEGKYQHQDIVFSYNDKFYAFMITRYGNYFYDFQYDSGVWEVEKKEIVTEQWVKII